MARIGQNGPPNLFGHHTKTAKQKPSGEMFRINSITPMGMRISKQLSDTEYHSRPSLSSTGGKLLLEAPAKYRYNADNPRDHKAAFEVGHATHTALLGVGEPVVVVDYPNWQTKAAREERDRLLGEGKTVLLPHEQRQVDAMVDAVLNNVTAHMVFTHPAREPEYSYEWDYPVPVGNEWSWAPMRARPDIYIPGVGIFDLKTTAALATADGWARETFNRSYHLQAAWYQHAVWVATGQWEPFHWVVVEKQAPHLTRVFTADPEMIDEGAQMMHNAAQLYAECSHTGVWPGYDDGITTISLPAWVTRKNGDN